MHKVAGKNKKRNTSTSLSERPIFVEKSNRSDVAGDEEYSENQNAQARLEERDLACLRTTIRSNVHGLRKYQRVLEIIFYFETEFVFSPFFSPKFTTRTVDSENISTSLSESRQHFGNHPSRFDVTKKTVQQLFRI